MKDSIAQQLHEAAEELHKVVRSRSMGTAEALNLALNRFLRPPYSARAASIKEAGGKTTQNFQNLIVANKTEAQTDSTVNADAVASANHVVETFNPEEINSAYAHIAIVKRLP